MEWLTIDRAIETTPSSPLTHQFEQSTFGTVLDARLLHCQFDDFAQADEVQDDAHLFEHTSYTRKTRAHSTIKNPDILVLLSEYGKLSFIMLNCAMNRFETLSLVRYMWKIGVGTVINENLLGVSG